MFEKDVFARRLSFGREVVYTLVGIALTVVAAGMLAWEVASGVRAAWLENRTSDVVEQLAFGIIIGLLVYGNFVYLFARDGYMTRLGHHRPAARDELETIYDRAPPPALTVLVPSYTEELAVVRQSLLSAALQEHPDRRVVLLIDDPPNPADPADALALHNARHLPTSIAALLAEPRAEHEAALAAFEQRLAQGPIDPAVEARRVAAAYDRVADWFNATADAETVVDHADRLFVAKVFREPAEAHRERGRQVREQAGALDAAALHREFRRLAALFRVELSSFERKQYANLSAEPNKAMNLNSYIDLLGGHWRSSPRDTGQVIERCEPAEATLHVPDADYLITLDADSILRWDYAMRLVHVMEQPSHARVAVTQTPYTAVPDAPGLVERVAGATTDMQYIVHQGFTRFNATYWVGANALLRVTALREIRTEGVDEHGRTVRRYIADRTVIEDTESSVDLAFRGWRLFNYPERMSYSATPPDYGSLLVQRRRWANGGLIILPKLLRYIFRGKTVRKLPECFMRMHYLISIAAVNIGVPILLLYPFEQNMRSIWVPLAAVGYFFFYGRDLIQAGYKFVDLLRVYAMNLLLIPVNLGGVLKSIEQGLTGRRIPFARTPKVRGRTTYPVIYVATIYLLAIYCFASSIIDVRHERWLHAVFTYVNGAFIAYALARFVAYRSQQTAPTGQTAVPAAEA